MTHINEGGVTPQQFVAQFAEDPPEPDAAPIPKRSARPRAPEGVPTAGAVDVQDDRAQLAGEWTWAEQRGDPQASDGVAVFMPSNHHQWAFQALADKLPARARSGKWQIYALIRVEPASAQPSGAAFSAGVWDSQRGADLGSFVVTADQAAATYKPYHIATVEMGPGRYVWIAPTSNTSLKGIWVDRLWFVPVP